MDAACRNCGTSFAGRYCPSCGQDASIALRPWRELLAEWADAVLGWETRTGRTLRALLLEPGRLTEEYAAGRRAAWLHPLRLYLGTSVVALAVFGATSQPIVQHYAADFGPDPRYSQFGSMILVISAAMVVLLPLAAACQALALRGLGRYYAEHLVAALHATAYCYCVESAASLLQYALLLVDAPFWALVVPRWAAHTAFILYSYRAWLRVYGLPPWQTVLRMALAIALLAPILWVAGWYMARGGA